MSAYIDDELWLHSRGWIRDGNAWRLTIGPRVRIYGFGEACKFQRRRDAAKPRGARPAKCPTCGCAGGNGSWLTTWRDGSLRSTEACPECHDCTSRCFQCLLGGRLAANKCSVAEKHKHKDCVCLEHAPATRPVSP